jgi:hypothetical protein
MLIHAEGHNRGEAPVKLYQVEENSGCVMVGNAVARIMLTADEVRKLYALLEPFANAERDEVMP